ncbi:MAG: hypothetical protein HFH88_13430 [Lachnospiraceae bacterium]|nr:hypothetical protein [Lachnospiraceae bacterium]
MEIFRLFGSIFIDTDAAEKSIQKTEKSTEGFASKLGSGIKTAAKWGTAIVTGATVAGTALFGMATKSASAADNIDKMSQKIGISREAYQELDFVCSQSGMSVNQLQAGVKALTAAMDGAKSGTAANVEQFERLGVAVVNADGSFRSQEDVLFDVIAALQGMDDQTEKARLATELFGRSGTELMPLLNGASGSIDEMRKQAHELGLVLSDEVIDNGVNLTDSLDQTKRAFENIGVQLGASLMPIVEKASDYIQKSLPAIQDLVGKLDPVITGLFENILPPLMDLAGSIFPILVDLAEQLIPPISELIGEILPILVEVIETFLPLLVEIVQMILPVLVELVRELLPPITEIVRMILPVLAELIRELLPPIIEVVQMILPILVELIQMVLPLIVEIVRAVLPVMVELIKALVSVLQPVLKLLEPLLDLVMALLKPLLELLEAILPPLIQVITEAAEVISDILQPIIEGLAKVIDGVLNNAFKSVAEIVERTVEFITRCWKTATETLSNIFEGLKENTINKFHELKENASARFQEMTEKISTKAQELKEKATAKFAELKEKVSSEVQELKEKAVARFQELKEKTEAKISELKDKITSKVSELKEKAVSKFNELKEKAGEKISSLKDRAVEAFDSMREKGLAGFEKLKSGALEKFEHLKAGISEKLEAVKNFVGNVVQKLKDFFKFDWKLPKIKLPHFTIDGSFSLNPPSIPKFGIDWYKSGGIMTKPTAFGINPDSGKVMAGGEAGPEAIAPIELLKQYVREAVEERDEGLYEVLEAILALLREWLPKCPGGPVVLDSGALVGELSSPMNEKLGWMRHTRGRWN